MKIAIANEHLNFFQHHHLIEFEEYLTPDQLLKLNKLLDQTLSKRMSIPVERIDGADPESVFYGGRDLWRDQEDLKKIVWHKSWADVAADLTGEKPVRAAFTQLVVPPTSIGLKAAQNHVYVEWFTQKRTLEEISSIEGLLCTLIVCLKGDDKERTPEETLDPIPRKTGNAIYVMPQVPLDFQAGNCRWLLIAYAKNKAQYIMQEKDPHVHYLKRLGHPVGAPLNDKLNPVLVR